MHFLSDGLICNFCKPCKPHTYFEDFSAARQLLLINSFNSVDFLSQQNTITFVFPIFEPMV